MNKLFTILFVIVSLVLMSIGIGVIWISPVYSILAKIIISLAIIEFISLPMMIIWDCKAK